MANAKIKLVKTVNFGSALTGRRDHVFYQTFDTLGTGSVSRTNTGVYELGSTGIYGAQLILSQSFSGSIVWEVTGSTSTVVFASDDVEVDTRLTRHFTVGQWELDSASNQLIFYQDDNVTEIGRFDLENDSGSPSVDSVFKRIRT
tara:strand:- start:2707 stop:3141 length:435 start_codon:yes stop_codon:yes gene_type:complete